MQDYKPNNVGFIRITQPSQHTIGLILLFIVKTNFTIRTSQATDGFIRHSAKPSFTMDFSGYPTNDYTQGQTQQGTSRPIDVFIRPLPIHPSSWVYHASKAVDRKNC